MPKSKEIITQQFPQRRQRDYRIGGIEGGGTHSTLIIMDGRGTVLTNVKGPGTNHWSLGMDETSARIAAMIERGKKQIGLPESQPLDFVGLALSGCEEEETNNQLSKILMEQSPAASYGYIICSDTFGSVKTATDSGGIVLIAGTGSNGLLINIDGSSHNCGGWGHMMGDEGGAYWIAYKAIKYVFDNKDGLVKSPHPTTYVWPAMKNYFHITNLKDMLPHLYTKFDKSHIALFTKTIAEGCDRGDPLCLRLFGDAGKMLAKHVTSLASKADKDMLTTGLKVVCVGSVWKSWKFMKTGFVKEIYENSKIENLSLMQLTGSSALGACYIAAEKIDIHFAKPYETNTKVFYQYNRANNSVLSGQREKTDLEGQVKSQ